MNSLGAFYLFFLVLIGVYFLFLIAVVGVGVRQLGRGKRLWGMALVAVPILWTVLPPLLIERAASRASDVVGDLQIIPDQIPLDGQSVLIVDLSGADMFDNPCGWLCNALLHYSVSDQIFVTSIDRFDWDTLDERFLDRIRETAPIYSVSVEGEPRASVRSLQSSLVQIAEWPETDNVILIDDIGRLAAQMPTVFGIPEDAPAFDLQTSDRLANSMFVYSGWPGPADLKEPSARMIGATIRVSGSGFLWLFESTDYRHVHSREAQEQIWCRWLDPSRAVDDRTCPG